MLWQERYRVSVPVSDDQHEELFRTVEDCVLTLRSNDEWNEKVDKINETLEFMKDYVVTHFHDEETYQKKIGYPGYEQHRSIHKGLTSYVMTFAQRYEKEGYKEELAQQFAGKLVAWLINHVASEDQR